MLDELLPHRAVEPPSAGVGHVAPRTVDLPRLEIAGAARSVQDRRLGHQVALFGPEDRVERAVRRRAERAAVREHEAVHVGALRSAGELLGQLAGLCGLRDRQRLALVVVRNGREDADVGRAVEEQLLHVVEAAEALDPVLLAAARLRPDDAEEGGLAGIARAPRAARIDVVGLHVHDELTRKRRELRIRVIDRELGPEPVVQHRIARAVVGVRVVAAAPAHHLVDRGHRDRVGRTLLEEAAPRRAVAARLAIDLLHRDLLNRDLLPRRRRRNELLVRRGHHVDRQGVGKRLLVEIIDRLGHRWLLGAGARRWAEDRTPCAPLSIEHPADN